MWVLLRKSVEMLKKLQYGAQNFVDYVLSYGLVKLTLINLKIGCVRLHFSLGLKQHIFQKRQWCTKTIIIH